MNKIDDAFHRVSRCCESSRHWEEYLELHRQEEKSHRRFCPDHIKCGLTNSQAMKLFAVKELLERIAMPNICNCGYSGACMTCPKCVKPTQSQKTYTPAIKDYFHIRKSIFAAVALFDECKTKLRKEFSKTEAQAWLGEIDYAELNKDPRQQEAA